MEYFSIVISLIGMLFVSIIGVYCWTYKVYKDTNQALADIYKVVNQHLQNADIHADVNKLVSSNVCAAVHVALKESVDEMKADIKILLLEKN